MNPLKESIKIIKKRNKTAYLILALIFFLLFVQAFFAGRYLYAEDKEKASELVKKITDTTKIKVINDAFEQKKYPLATLLIFTNNFLIDAFSLYLGITIIFPIFIFLSNSLALGVIFGIHSLTATISLQKLIFILIVGLLEISAFVIIINESIRISIGLISPKTLKKKNVKIALKESLREGTIILSLIIILLLAAAIIETIGIALLG